MSELLTTQIPISNDELSELLSEQREVQLLFQNINRFRRANNGTFHQRQRPAFAKAAEHLKSCLDALKEISNGEINMREILKLSK